MPVGALPFRRGTEIYVMNADDRKQTRLTSSPADYARPSPHRDGHVSGRKTCLLRSDQTRPSVTAHEVVPKSNVRAFGRGDSRPVTGAVRSQTAR